MDLKISIFCLFFIFIICIFTELKKLIIMSFKPRKRQQEAIDKMVDFVNSKSTKKGLFVYPTSFGKSIIIANVANKFPDKYFINVTSNKELLSQNFEKFISYGYQASLCSASLGSREVGKITFATIGTLVSQIDYFKDKDVVILLDEAHTASKKGSQIDKFISQVKSCKLIGTTATPIRLKSGINGTELKMMNRDRDCIFSSIEDLVQIQEVVQDSYWSKLVYDIKEVDESVLELNKSGTDYTDESLKEYSQINEISEKCIEEVKILLKEGRKSILIFVPFIDDAVKIESIFKDCKAVYSGMDKIERDNIIKGFRNLDIKVIAQINILSIGFDHPQLDAIVFARPTNSITIWYQGLGRGVRIHPEKKDCKIVDISGNFNKFGRVEDINFENNSDYGGWAAFSGNNLLTNYPLGMNKVPTKESLKEKQEINYTLKISFGKYKDKTVSEVIKDPDGKRYLAWIIEPSTKFNFYGEYGKKLKNQIHSALRVPIKKDLSDKELITNYTNNIKIVKDLNGIF